MGITIVCLFGKAVRNRGAMRIITIRMHVRRILTAPPCQLIRIDYTYSSCHDVSNASGSTTFNTIFATFMSPSFNAVPFRAF